MASKARPDGQGVDDKIIICVHAVLNAIDDKECVVVSGDKYREHQAQVSLKDAHAMLRYSTPPRGTTRSVNTVERRRRDDRALTGRVTFDTRLKRLKLDGVLLENSIELRSYCANLFEANDEFRKRLRQVVKYANEFYEISIGYAKIYIVDWANVFRVGQSALFAKYKRDEDEYATFDDFKCRVDISCITENIAATLLEFCDPGSIIILPVYKQFEANVAASIEAGESNDIVVVELDIMHFVKFRF